ncbi:MAG: hypothetical protein AAF827_17020 [Cyanobacteria bacterium P01_D01_bin.6]
MGRSRSAPIEVSQTPYPVSTEPQMRRYGKYVIREGPRREAAIEAVS